VEFLRPLHGKFTNSGLVRALAKNKKLAKYNLSGPGTKLASRPRCAMRADNKKRDSVVHT
jgi:hypothetical protein